MTVNAGATVVIHAAHGSSRQDFVDKLLDRTHGLEDQQRYATLWAMKDTAGGGQDNTVA
jgi:hypothetical protein